MVTQEEVLETLNQTGDPEVGIGIVDLGLIVDCEVESGYVKVALRTTTPRCPFQPFIMMEAHRKVMQLAGVKGVEVEVTHESPWHPNMMTEAAKTRLGFLPSRLELEAQRASESRVEASTER